MVRLARFTPEAFTDAAIALVAEGGPSAATIAAIARSAGAPTGSVYHRFESRAAVIATAWIAVHGDFSTHVIPPLEAGDAAGAAMSIVKWARDEPTASRFLLLNEIEDLLDTAPPEALRSRIAAQQEALDESFHRASRAVDRPAGMAEDQAAARLRFLVFDGPLAVLRPHLLAGRAIPPYADDLIRELHGGTARRRPAVERVA
jgi:AcrR family transcriptional regulator